MAQMGSLVSDNIQKWLQRVEDHLTPESLEFVKLCFYYDIEYVNYESIESPTKLFDHLLKYCYESDELKTLQFFVNALHHIGSDLRGRYLVENCLSECYLACPPSPKDEDLSKEAHFCLCLVKIGKKSRGLELEKKLKKHFCRPQFLSMNLKNIPHLPTLFVKLIQKKFIQWDETASLVESFNNYGAQLCLNYLQQYYKKVGLPQLSWVNREGFESPSSHWPSELDNFSSSRRMLKNPGKSRELAILGSKKKGGASVNKLEVSRSAPQNGSYFDENAAQTFGGDKDSDCDSTESDSLLGNTQNTKQGRTDLNTGLETTIIHNNLYGGASGVFCSKRHKCCCIGLVCLSFLCLTLLGVIFGTAWIHLFSSGIALAQGEEGTVVVLEEINQFFVQEVNIRFEYLVSEMHIVDVYQYDHDCADLPISPKKQVVSTRFKDLVNMYLLEGTSIRYSLVLTTADVVEVFLTSGLETSGFNPHQLHKGDIICHDEVTYGHSTQCFHQVYESGYYNVHFLLPPSGISAGYNLSVIFTNSSILITNLNHKCTVDKDTDCDVSFSFSKSVSCLVGNILKTNTTHPYVTVGVNIDEFWLGPVLGITMTIFVLCPIVFLAIFCIFLFKLC